VEGANKMLGTTCLITDATKKLLPSNFQTRRICRVQLYGLIEPVELYELEEPNAPETWRTLRTQYETALEHIEMGNALACLQGCAKIIATGETVDGPTRWLLSQANAKISSGDQAPVKAFTFEGK
jgi:hypothetical protein